PVEERLLIGAVRGDLVRARYPGIEAVEADRALDLRELVASDHALRSEEGELVGAIAALLDRDDGLPEQVAAHDRCVGAVELRRAEELPPEQVRAVDVGRVVER